MKPFASNFLHAAAMPKARLQAAFGVTDMKSNQIFPIVFTTILINLVGK